MLSASQSARPARPGESSAPCALRLVRGAASQPDRALRALASGVVIAVGAGMNCDWRLQATGVPPLALWIRVLAGTLFVRSAGGCAVRVDGHELGSLWTPIEHGSCVSVGGADFEIGLDVARRPSALADEDEPMATIFGADEGVPARPGRPRGRWTFPLRTAASLWIAGALLAGAYRCWILLLDRF